MAEGLLNWAESGGPLSPQDAVELEHTAPVPATVVMIPLLLTLRIRLFPASAMYTLPEPSTATPLGVLRLPLVAAFPSSDWGLVIVQPRPANTESVVPVGSTL